jgi:hypothetical protein
MSNRPVLRPLLLTLALLLLSPLAPAQYGLSNPLIGLKTAPPVTKSDIRIIDSILGLDESQRSLTGALYDDFFERFRVEAKAIEAELTAMIDESIVRQDSTITREAEDKAEQWDQRRLEWRAEFLTDLKLLLDQQQVELWPKVERELRRHDLIGRGRLAGEKVDLIRLVDAHVADWDANTELVEALDRYADQLDRALRARQRALDDEQTAEFWCTCQDEPYRAREIYEDVLPTRVRVRDINLESFRAIRKLLSESDAVVVERAFYSEALRSHSPISPIETRIRAASSLPSLSSAQREQIATILQDYEPRRHRAVVGFFDAVAEMEAELLPDTIANKIAQIEHDASGADPAAFRVTDRVPQDVKDALGARLETDLAVWRRINAALSPDQRADLPRPDEDIIWFREYLSHEL